MLPVLLALLLTVRPVPAAAAPFDPAAVSAALAVINPLGPYITGAMILSPYPCESSLNKNSGTHNVPL